MAPTRIAAVLICADLRACAGRTPARSVDRRSALAAAAGIKFAA